MQRPAWLGAEQWTLLRLSAAGVFLGIVGAVMAFVLLRLIFLATNLAYYGRGSATAAYPPLHPQPWMAIIPAAGGLIVGLIAQYGSEQIRGHGIPETMEAIIAKQSRIGPGVAILKPLSASIAVGTGGPFGAEGPTIQTGGAIGSLLAQAFTVSAVERKVFLACGAAAGLVGIFNTPISAVALAVELLLFEFRPRSLIPVVLASGTAAAARTFLLGSGAIFLVPPAADATALALPLYVPLGILVGIFAVIIGKALFAVERFFKESLKLPAIMAPAAGGLFVGLLGLVEPRVLGAGYPIIVDTVSGRLDAAHAVDLSLGKALALCVALGSGTSGGLLAPMLLIGAAFGSAYGQVVRPLFPALGLSPEVCAIVAMGALFGAAARIPFTSFVFGFELTGDYHALAPLMIGCMTANVVARLLSEHSLLTEPLAVRGIFVPQRYVPDVLNYLRVKALLRTDFPSVPFTTTLRQLLAESRIVDRERQELYREPSVSEPMFWQAVRPDGTMAGLLTRHDLYLASRSPGGIDRPVSQFAKRPLIFAFPNEPLHRALDLMLRNDTTWLPVLEPGHPQCLLGYIRRDDVLSARSANLEEEVIREAILRPTIFQEGAELVQQIERPEPESSEESPGA